MVYMPRGRGGGLFEAVPLVEVMYFVFTRMAGENYHRRLWSLLSLCDVFQALINSLVCCYNCYPTKQKQKN